MSATTIQKSAYETMLLDSLVEAKAENLRLKAELQNEQRKHGFCRIQLAKTKKDLYAARQLTLVAADPEMAERNAQLERSAG